MAVDNAPAGRIVGQEQHTGDGELTEVTVDQDNWTEVASFQSGKVLKYFPGFGVGDRRGQVGYVDFDAEATGGGNGADGDHIEGTFRWVVYNDPEKDDLAADGPYMRTEPLRQAVSANLTEKVMVPMHRIGAPEDGYLVLEFKADSSYDGYVLESDDTAHSGTLQEQGFVYTQIRNRT